MTSGSGAIIDKDVADRVASHAANTLQSVLAKPMAPGLYIVSTPIGNLADITLRALATLAAADIIYCEDTRHSRTLVAHFGVKAPLRPYHEHNAEAARPQILAALQEGRRIALISDAGTPLISDPGYKLARDVLDAGHNVIAIPGASAVLAGLVVSGLPTDCFFFAGFLPPKSGARKERLGQLATIEATLVLYEAPSRVATCLADIAEMLGNREVSIARELTKLNETITRGPVQSVLAALADIEPRGEYVILVAPPDEQAASDAEIIARLLQARSSLSTRDSVQAVAEALRVPKTRVYALAIGLKSDE